MGGTLKGSLHPAQRLPDRLSDPAAVVDAEGSRVRGGAGRSRDRAPVVVLPEEHAAVLRAILLQVAEEGAAPQRIPDSELRKQQPAWNDGGGRLLLGDQSQ